jgi:hypothetical protein
MFGVDRGVGMIFLQVLRACTVISLCMAIVACWILMLHLGQGHPWFVFEGASLFFLSVFAMGLVLTEFPMINKVRNFLHNNFGMLGPDSGLGWLGTCLVIIGCNILGKLNQPAFQAKKIGGPFSDLTLASGILIIIFGVANVISTFLWSDRKEGITARHVRTMGSLAAGSQAGSSLPKFNDKSSYKSSAASSTAREEKPRKKFLSIFRGASDESYHERPVISGPFPGHGGADDSYDEERGSPIIPGVKRPASALHPMHTASSRYSAATMDRF